MDARQFRGFAARRIPMLDLSAGHAADRLLRVARRGTRGPSAQPLGREREPEARAWRRASRGEHPHRADPSGAQYLPRSAPQQSRRAGALRPLWLLSRRPAARLLPRRPATRRRARIRAPAVSRRRAEILAEMGLAPVWRLRREASSPAAVQHVAGASAELVREQAVIPVSFEAREQRILSMDWQALKGKVAGCTDCR